jgi:hypothetical protein
MYIYRAGVILMCQIIGGHLEIFRYYVQWPESRVGYGGKLGWDHTSLNQRPEHIPLPTKYASVMSG